MATTYFSSHPGKVALLGSGPLPLTATFVVDQGHKVGKEISVLCVDWMEDRIKKSERVCRKLGDYPSIRFQVADISVGPEDLAEFDLVYCVALVGTTQEEKQNLFLSVAKRMREGAILITRSTFALKTLAYPVSRIRDSNLKVVLNNTDIMLCQALNILEKDLPAWIQPVTVVKSYGVPGVSLNVS